MLKFLAALGTHTFGAETYLPLVQVHLGYNFTCFGYNNTVLKFLHALGTNTFSAETSLLALDFRLKFHCFG